MTPLRPRDMRAGAGADVALERIIVERFGYVPTRRTPQLLGLSLRTPFELPDSARPALIVEQGTLEQVFPPRLTSMGSYQPPDAADWLWRGVFAVPSEIVSDREALFALRLFDELILTLPALRVARARPGVDRVGWGRNWPYALRRGALLLIVTCQLGLMPGLSVGGALADGRIRSGMSVEAAPEPAPETPPVGEPEREPQPEEAAPTPPGEPTPEPPSEPSPEPPAESPQPTPNEPGPQPPSEPQAGATTPTSAMLAPSPPVQPPTSPVAASPVAPAKGAGTRSRTAKEKTKSPVLHRRAHARHPAPKSKARHEAAKAAPVSAPALPGAPVFEGLPPGFANIEPNDPPPYLVPIYQQAARRYHVPWSVLAAINQIETDYGSNLSVSSAGALGWMQFMPETWQRWGVDADHDGVANPYSPQDAIFAAARYLQASGASRDLPGAIFAYNHAAWYVSEVLLRARTIGNTATFARIEKDYSLPLDARYMQQLGRTDDGVDIETPPDGALVYSITPGVVSAVASDPAGFGPDYPVIEATAGAFAGQHIYYGHVAQALVQPGQRVAAGQPIAIVGHTGDAVSLGHGHIEIGFSDAGGAPLNQHGAQAWTPAGDAMRGFLVELSVSFGIHNT